MFAGNVMIGDLNDFIQPSQSCINPRFMSSTAPATHAADQSEIAGRAKIEIASDFLATT
jgi:hypothetical protein